MVSGKNMPCDPGKREASEAKRMVSSRGVMIAQGEGYPPHWASCTME